MARNVKYPIEKKLEKLIEVLTVELRRAIRKIVWFLTSPIDGMIDFIWRLSILFLIITTLLKWKGY